jgi:3-hydroxybutyryl-CoA dehydratase
VREFRAGEIATFSKTVTEADVYAFAGITGDFNPLHVNAEFARQSRFGERIAHGMLTAGLISTVLGMRLPGPGAIFLGQTLKFLKPVRFGDTITAEAEVLSYRSDKRIVTLRTICTNQHAERVLEGEATLMVDPVPEGFS